MDLEHFKRMREKLINDFIDEICQKCDEDIQSACEFCNQRTYDVSGCDKFEGVRKAINLLNESIEYFSRNENPPDSYA